MADGQALAADAGLQPATPLARLVAGGYSPVYVFDGDEDHFPDDVREWLRQSDLKRRDDGT